jgi:hypothetical protein
MSVIAELECILTTRAVREKFPLKRGKYLIGRCSKEEIKGYAGYYNRLPDWARGFIDDATHSIPIRGCGNGSEDYYISRAQIWLAPGETHARIIDLRSKNRTYVNGSRVQSDDEGYEVRYIYPGDTVSIGAGVVNLKYRLLPQVRYPHHALLVGYEEDEEDLETVRNNVYALKKEIVKRGFAGNTLEFTGAEARKDRILTELRDLGKETPEDSVLLFYFAGNTQRSRSRKLRVYDGYISPKELFGALKASWCQKLFIMDGPYTSVMTKYDMPPRSVLIGNREEAWEGGIKSRSGDIMRYLTRAVCKALQGRESIDMKTLLNEIRKDSLIHSARQEVVCARKTLIELPGETPGPGPEFIQKTGRDIFMTGAARD